DINADPWWSIYAGAGFGVGINVSILSRDIYDHEWDFNDLGFEVLVADAGNPANTAPTASFTVSPTNGTTGTIFTFDASGSTDNEDPVSQLEVRWDFDGDGSWDTGWDYDKTENHQYSAEGTYTAKMEVKDTEGLTDQTTQTVTVSGGSNTPPTAIFSVSPSSGSTSTIFEFDGSDSYDNEDPTSQLQVRWDFDGNGTWDTGWDYDKTENHQYSTEGTYTAKMEVKDTEGLTDYATQTVTVDNGGGNGCDGQTTLTYGGQTYDLVEIGDQCWMAENLNIGIRIDGSEEMEDNGTIEKYCLDNDPANCDEYGGLYQWNEMMQYATQQGVQGICPDGWHLPGDDEWCTLTTYIDPTVNCDEKDWIGTDAGYKIKSTSGWYSNGNGSDAYGFAALPGGWRHEYNGGFVNLEEDARFWSSTGYGTSAAWHWRLWYNYDEVLRRYKVQDWGFSVRCVKD
ncbi:MAG: hypothetical protein K9H13_05645, partial [Bacteroidales bacterium]|nr:hypothetical protein [Bacteroidales bacterium]